MYDFCQVMHNIATAVKNAIEPMFGTDPMTATSTGVLAQSAKNKNWIKKARKVCCTPDHTAVASTWHWKFTTYMHLHTLTVQ